jgi:hypothetical protein
MAIPTKFLLPRFLASMAFNDVQLQITIDGKKPKEWFVVPFPIIEQAVHYLIKGKSIAYDKDIEQLIVLSEE